MKKKNSFRKIAFLLSTALVVNAGVFDVFSLNVSAGSRSIRIERDAGTYTNYSGGFNGWKNDDVYVNKDPESEHDFAIIYDFEFGSLHLDGVNLNLFTSYDDADFRTTLTVNRDVILENARIFSTGIGTSKLTVKGDIYICHSEDGVYLDEDQFDFDGEYYAYVPEGDKYTIEGTKSVVDPTKYISSEVVIKPMDGFSVFYDSNGSDYYEYRYSQDTAARTASYRIGEYVSKPFTIEAINFKRYGVAPSGDAFTLEGTKSESGDYYTSNVTLKVPEGYKFYIIGEYTPDNPKTYTSKEFTESTSAFSIALIDPDGQPVEGAIADSIETYFVRAINIQKGYTKPEKEYTISGTKYKDKYYQSDVEIKPAQGYKILTKEMVRSEKEPVSSLKFTKTTKDVRIYLVDPEGYYSDEIKVGDIYILREGEGKVTVSDAYYGGKIIVKPETKTNDVKKVTYKYKKSTGGDYLPGTPTAVGKYICEATFDLTDNYKEVVVKDDFEIKYLPAPTEAYTITGKGGDNDYYTSDVKIAAPEGYLISRTLGTGYTSYLLIQKDTPAGYVYLKKVQTGEMTDKIRIKEFKIDKQAPVLSGVTDNENLYSDNKTITISDDNLEELVINGEKVDIKGNSVSYILDADGGFNVYEIIMKDKAGNINTITVTILSEWMKSGEVITGKLIRLYPGKFYAFPDKGKTYSISDDPNVYYGGNKFTVKGNLQTKFN